MTTSNHLFLRLGFASILDREESRKYPRDVYLLESEVMPEIERLRADLAWIKDYFGVTPARPADETPATLGDLVRASPEIRQKILETAAKKAFDHIDAVIAAHKTKAADPL